MVSASLALSVAIKELPTMRINITKHNCLIHHILRSISCAQIISYLMKLNSCLSIYIYVYV